MVYKIVYLVVYVAHAMGSEVKSFPVTTSNGEELLYHDTMMLPHVKAQQ